MEVHDTTLITTIVVSLAFGYAGGVTARILGLPNIVGYLIAGIIVGPYTPGFVADQKLARELADIGVALLMFTVGLHFSLRDLIAVWTIAVPGAALQILGASILGWGVGIALGWPMAASGVLGLAIAISSTAVAIRSLEERGLLASNAGRITLGWLVVQDVVVVVALVLLPVSTTSSIDFTTLILLACKAILSTSLFIVVLVVLGRWLLPAILGWTARLSSQELFTLGVIVIALGVAYSSSVLLGVSLALGAFFAGLVLGESDLSHQAAAESLPIQNIFTVLFFVSVGMLFNPMLLITAPLEIVSLVAAVIFGGGLIFLVIMVALRMSPRTAGLVAGSLTQVGEFSFILTGAAVSLGIMGIEQQGVLLAAALSSILLHSLTIRGLELLGQHLYRLPILRERERKISLAVADIRALASLRRHVIIVGHGRVGSVIATGLGLAGQTFAVIEGNWRKAKALRTSGAPVVFGDATRLDVLKAARPRHAKLIVVALPDAFQSRRVIELVRQSNPEICIVARAHSEAEYRYLTELGCALVIMGEREIALSMTDYTLQRMGVNAIAAQALVDELRGRAEQQTDARHSKPEIQ
jgi:monovalent cation:H+ antiporter-2, CPA2 family